MVVCADYSAEEFYHISHDVDEELRMFLGRVPKPCIKTASSLSLWSPTDCHKCVSNCFFKLVKLAFGKDALDQAFSRSAKNNNSIRKFA